MEEVIHETLECGSGVSETEEHDNGFEEAFVSDKGGLSLVTIFDADIVIAPTDIKLGKELASLSLSRRLEIRGRGYIGRANSVSI